MLRKNRAVFLDKDGTLVKNTGWRSCSKETAFLPGVTQGLSELQRLGFLLIMVTNQPAIERKLFSKSEFERLLLSIRLKLDLLNINFHDFYYCPHLPAKLCACRKPKPGMFFRAAIEHCIDLKGSWMIGDILDDVQAGKQAGCRTVLINNGNETEWVLTRRRFPDHIGNNFKDAMDVIKKAINEDKFLQKLAEGPEYPLYKVG